MQEVSVLVILSLLVYTISAAIDQISVQCGLYTPLFAVTFIGLLLGNLQTGLAIGVTLQLMTLGVAAHGGTMIPDYLLGVIMGTAYAIISGQGAEYDIGLVIPIGFLLTQTDILGKTSNSFFQHYADRCAEKGDWRSVEKANLLGLIPWGLSRLILVVLGLIFGQAMVEGVNAVVPAWFMTELRIASAILPIMGMAILMCYLSTRKYWLYFVIGFVLTAFGGGSYTVMAAALVGLALAEFHLTRTKDRVVTTTDGASYIDDEKAEIDG